MNNDSLLSKLISKSNMITKEKFKNVEKFTKLIEEAFYNKFNGNMNISYDIYVRCNRYDDKNLDIIERRLEEDGLLVHEFYPVLISKNGTEYPENYYEICKKKNIEPVTVSLYYALRYTLSLNYKSKEELTKSIDDTVKQLRKNFTK